MDIENEILKDFEERKKIKELNEKQSLIQQKTNEWMELSIQYNTLLDAALEDETLLDGAFYIKEQMKAKQSEIDELNKVATI